MPLSDAGGTNMSVMPRNIVDEVGVPELVLVVPLVLPLILTGGHSRTLRCSSFTASLM